MKMTCFVLYQIVLTTLFLKTQGQGIGAVRLYNNDNTDSSLTDGYVQIYYDNIWIPICSSNQFEFLQEEADTVCRQLRKESSLSYSLGMNASYGNLTGVTKGLYFQCDTNTSLTVLSCNSSNKPEVQNCSTGDVAAVECSSTDIWASPYDTQIRLTHGTFVTDGLVEIYCLYEWGTINRDGFDQLDVDTLCKQLGYTEASAFNHSIDGNTNLVFHFPNIDCTSSDQCIASCQSCGIGNIIDRSDLLHSLSHKGDLYINCTYNISSDVVPANTDTCVNANHLNLAQVILALVLVILAAIVIVCLPFCVCFCLGIGIGATIISASSTRRAYKVKVKT